MEGPAICCKRPKHTCLGIAAGGPACELLICPATMLCPPPVLPCVFLMTLIKATQVGQWGTTRPLMLMRLGDVHTTAPHVSPTGLSVLQQSALPP